MKQKKKWSKFFGKRIKVIEVIEDGPLVEIPGLGIKVHPSLANHYRGPFTKNINWDWESSK